MQIKTMRRYKCGCRGIPVDPQDPSAVLVFYSCGGETHEPFVRGVIEPEIYQEVCPDEAANLVRNIALLVSDGEAMREIRNLLRDRAKAE